MNALRVTLMALHGMLLIAAQGHAFSTDEKLAEWLLSTKAIEAVSIRRVILTQAGKPLAWYELTGREETWRRLNQRPILTPRGPAGPFARSVQFVARVDRTQAMHLVVEAEWIRIDARGLLRRAPITDCWLRLKPAPDVQVTLGAVTGQFMVPIPSYPVCAEAEFTFRSGAERHILRLDFLNARQPVTLSTPSH